MPARHPLALQVTHTVSTTGSIYKVKQGGVQALEGGAIQRSRAWASWHQAMLAQKAAATAMGTQAIRRRVRSGLGTVENRGTDNLRFTLSQAVWP